MLKAFLLLPLNENTLAVSAKVFSFKEYAETSNYYQYII